MKLMRRKPKLGSQPSLENVAPITSQQETETTQPRKIVRERSDPTDVKPASRRQQKTPNRTVTVIRGNIPMGQVTDRGREARTGGKLKTCYT